MFHCLSIWQDTPYEKIGCALDDVQNGFLLQKGESNFSSACVKKIFMRNMIIVDHILQYILTKMVGQKHTNIGIVYPQNLSSGAMLNLA